MFVDIRLTIREININTNFEEIKRQEQRFSNLRENIPL